MNSVMGQRLRLDPDRCQGMRLAELGFPPGKVQEWEGAIEQAISQGKPVEWETEWARRHYSCQVIPETSAPGAQATVLSLTRDITAKRLARLSDAMRLARAERLDEVGVALDHAGLDVETVLDVIARFASTFVGETCFITLRSDDGRDMTGAVVHDPDPTRKDWGWRVLKAAPFRADGPIFSKLLATGEPLNLAEVPADYLRSVLRPEHQEIAAG